MRAAAMVMFFTCLADCPVARGDDACDQAVFQDPDVIQCLREISDYHYAEVYGDIYDYGGVRQELACELLYDAVGCSSLVGEEGADCTQFVIDQVDSQVSDDIDLYECEW